MAIRWPVGTPNEDAVALTRLPGFWKNTNPFLTPYQFGLHTGIDLNNNTPVFNTDKGAPLYAIEDGIVTFSGLGDGPSWGWITILDCTTFVVRYAHTDHFKYPVRLVGERLKRGDVIGYIGNADGYYKTGDHAHIDITTTNILLVDASDWPGSDRARLLLSYVDPIKFIIERKAVPMPDPIVDEVIVTADPSLLVRAAPVFGATVLTKLPLYSVVDVLNWNPATAYVKLVDQPGYVATQYINPVIRELMKITASPALRLRAGPGKNYAILAQLSYLTNINVLRGSQVNGYIKLADRPGWVALEWLTNIAPPPAIIDNIPDLSHHTPIQDFAAAFWGVPIFIHKGTQGVSFADPVFRGRRDRYRALVPGGSVIAWHNGTNHNAIEQAEWCLSNLADGATGIALDLETISAAEGGTMTLAQAEEFVNYIHAERGIWVACYLRPGYLPAVESILSNCPLWVSSAHWPPLLPYQWRDKGWVINQYDQQVISGIPVPVDINRAALTLAQVPAFIKSIAPAAGELAIATKYVSLTATPRLNVRSGAGLSFPVVGTIDPGAEVKVYEPAINGWYRLFEG